MPPSSTGSGNRLNPWWEEPLAVAGLGATSWQGPSGPTLRLRGIAGGPSLGPPGPLRRSAQPASPLALGPRFASVGARFGATGPRGRQVAAGAQGTL